MLKNVHNLPGQFRERMKALLGEEYDVFLASFDHARRNGLRVNRLKTSPERFGEMSPFVLERVPWTDNGYYVDYREAPGQHPFYRAGLYYLQEPSAMAPAAILPVSPGDRVLDLCAAPGGKATEFGTRLAGEGLLVANEISKTRVRALEHNIELFGIRNCIVTNEAPKTLAERFPAYFDSVLVDAPCSGEGMFRKNPEAVSTWSPEKVRECACVQREILPLAADMLRPGGYMVYSTCTFEPEEDELAVLFLLRERPDLELVEIPLTDGRESFSRAYSPEELARKGFGAAQRKSAEEEAFPEDTPALPAPDPGTDRREKKRSEPYFDLTRAVRIWPHRAGGEGHFIALLRKREEAAGTERPSSILPEEPDPPETQPAGEGYRGRREKGRNGQKRSDREGRAKKRGGRQDRKKEESSSPELVLQFMERYPLERSVPELSSPERSVPELSSSERNAPEQSCSDREIDIDRIEIRNSNVYLLPENCPDLRGLRFLRAGLYLGELKKNRFEPSQGLAMVLRPRKTMERSGDIASAEEYIDDGRSIRIRPDSRLLAEFLTGAVIKLEDTGENGWRLVCAGNWPVGWGKLTGHVLKNHIPGSWRAPA